MALEGNEVEGKIGSGGGYIVDVDAKGMVKAELTYAEGSVKGGAFVELDLVDLLEKAAAKTENTIDDAAVKMIKSALGR